MKTIVYTVLVLISCLLPLDLGVAQQLDSPLSSNVTATPDSINFGQVIISKSKTLTFTLKNTGTLPILVSTYGVANSIEYNVTGPSNYTLPPNGTQVYSVTFAPLTTQPAHTGSAQFTFGDLSTVTVFFVGYDHFAITGTLAIRKDYLARAGSTVTVSQELTSNLAGALDSIYNFTEYILYDPAILDFIGVNNGAITPASNWTVHSTLGTPGNVAIRAGSLNYALKGPGELLQLVFHVNSQDAIFSSSAIWDTSAIFGSGAETQFYCDTGAVHIVGQCTPITGEAGFTTHVWQAAPNPANDRASIKYSIARDALGKVPSVSIRLFDAVGNLIQTIQETPDAEGKYTAELNTAGLSPGAYYYEFDAGAVREVKRLFVLH